MDCTVREWVKEDAFHLAQALNNRNIQDNLRDGLPYPYTVEDAENFILAMLSADKGRVYPFAIVIGDMAVGSIGVFRKENIHRLTAEMGYYIAEPYWGKGLVTSAVQRVCEYIFARTDIVRIFAEPFCHNIASCRVLEKSGFTCEGTLRKNAIKNGKIIDMKLYALIKE